jgi:hypothetical protein
VRLKFSCARLSAPSDPTGGFHQQNARIRNHGTPQQVINLQYNPGSRTRACGLYQILSDSRPTWVFWMPIRLNFAEYSESRHQRPKAPLSASARCIATGCVAGIAEPAATSGSATYHSPFYTSNWWSRDIQRAFPENPCIME